MMDQELLRDRTESYLKRVISSVADSLRPDFDSLGAFGELGINSFQVLKIIKKLEHDFGTLPKSLLFESFNVHDLGMYFAKHHDATLLALFADETRGQRPEAVVAHEEREPGTEPAAAAAITIREESAYADPDLKELVGELYARHKIEGSVSRGTRVIAPNLFIGRARRGYFHYARSRDIIVVYGYTGPEDYLPLLLAEIDGYCADRKCQLNILTDNPIVSIGERPFSATPFGVLQRIHGLKTFALDGGPMRRLRYQVSKFQRSGRSRTIEYLCGSDPETDGQIAETIDLWCQSRSAVNPLVHQVKADILAGKLASEHRVFITYLDDVLQNVILITSMSGALNGYLLDLEFYRPDMPLGGLEYAVVEVIGTLASEGYDLLSLGGTYGCRLVTSPAADPAVDKLLDELQSQNIFNDAGNLQFKNKFRPETRTIYLCRPAGDAADNVIDIIMMIADPLQVQTREEEEPLVAPRVEPAPVVARPVWLDGDDRSSILAQVCFNPLRIPHERVEIDLKTDSWAQLHMPTIEARMRHLQSQLQQRVNVEEAVRAVFPFDHFVLTSSGQAAERVFFKAWPKKGVIPQNLLFPSTLFHQIDSGFTPRELPHPAIFQLKSAESSKAEIELAALEGELRRDASAIACVCIEVGNNAAGGHLVSTQHLREVRALLSRHSVSLVIDATRVLQNAHDLIEREKEHAGKAVWAVVRESLSYADVVIGSLTKELCVDKGGIIACKDGGLHERVRELLDLEGSGLDLIEKKRIALSLQNRKYIESRVAGKIEHARRIGRALTERGIPVAHSGGGHCVLIDVRAIPEFSDIEDPVPSFVAWLYLATGVRAAGHNVGMQSRTSINHLARLAVPAGLRSEEVDGIIDRLVQAFARKTNIPELVLESRTPKAAGGIDARYRLERYRNARTVASRPTVTANERESVSVAPRRSVDVAVVGMAGRYPKAKNVRELWRNLVGGVDCIEEIPADRYERRLQYGSTAKYRGGFIDDVDKFDSLFFNISPREAEMLDPQERLFLEVAWEALEDAGYHPEGLAREGAPRNIGVYVGAVWAMYQMIGIDEQYAGHEVSPNSFLWSIANRVSYWMNLAGPSLTVDTACSSSLTALHLACEAIQAGECAAAIVGGVNLDLHQAKFDINRVGGALSPDGVCRAFGRNANGYVAGEGVGALLLKPLEQAEANGDHIYGLIRSAVVNHGGRTSGYFVPNPAAQSSVIQAALAKAKISAQSVGYVEAHGTGTELGDPIEIAGLSTAFRGHDVPNQSCAVGSIKTNIGHLEAAAGVVSITKVLLQMQHRRLVPSLHSAEANPFIDFEHSPFYLVGQKAEEWKAKEADGVCLPLRAGVSSFGAGGANAHVILESYDPRERADTPAADLIFPLSARNEEQLAAMATRLVEFLRENHVDLRDAAFTLQHGRKSFEQRLAIVAQSREELLAKLTRFIDGKKDDDVAVGHAKLAESVTRLLNRREKQEFVRLLLEAGDPRKIARLWTEGLLADWQGLQPNAAARRIPLPTYPFADKRHWCGRPLTGRRAVEAAAGLHPMVDSNESTFERQLFKKTFHRRDFFIYDHLVSDIPTLPGVAYLELARKAGDLAAGRPVRRIQNIVWVSPIAVRDSTPQEVFIELKPTGAAVQFEVFSELEGKKILHAQGKLLYTDRDDGQPEYVDLDAIRARCTRRVDGKNAYPLFESTGLSLGPSFQVLEEVHNNEKEALGVLLLPELRRADLQELVLHPSLIDGSLQAGMAARLAEGAGEMLVPYSIGEVEILASLPARCFSYTTEADGKRDSSVRRSNVLILDETGKVVVRIRESAGVPLMKVHKKADVGADGFSRLYYAYDWEKADLAADESDRHNPQGLVLFGGDETLRQAYQSRTAAQVVLVRPGNGFAKVDDYTYEIAPEDSADFTRVLESLAVVDDIGFAWTGDRAVFSLLFLCQALIKAKLESRVQLLYIHARSGEALPLSEAMGGFINTLHTEHPKLICKALHVQQETESSGDTVDALLAELGARTQDAIAVRYEAGQRYVRKMKAFDLEASDEVGRLRDRGVYLITGGVGGLGLIFAEFLAKTCQARLVLTGRSELSEARKAKLDDLRKLGAEVLYVATDVSKREDVEDLRGRIKARFGGVNGVIHAAGLARDSFIRNKTVEEMEAVFAPKIQGTLLLDEATKDEPLDFFGLFSSLAAVTGNPGQADYGFANSFMDSFAAGRERLRASGARAGKSLSINWSLWADGGMRPDEQTELAMKKTLGMKPLTSAVGVEAFMRGLASPRSQFVVVEGVQEKLEIAWGVRKRAPAAPPIQAAAGPLADQDNHVLRQWMEDELSQIVMRLLKMESGDVAPDKILLDLGFDSIGLTTYANAINERFQLDITPVLFFDRPSIVEIAKALVEERKDELLRVYHRSGSEPAPRPVDPQPVGGAPAFENRKAWGPAAVREPAAAVPTETGSPALRFIERPIAIVGMSGVMPQSEDLEEFWENLKSSRDLVTLIPPERWRWEDYYGDPLKEANKTHANRGAFMREIDKFDPLFFGISPREAQMMDPQQRIFLEHVWKAVEDSGRKVSELSGTKTGVFVGVATNDYIDVMNTSGAVLDGYSASGNSHSVLANRVSFLLGLRGPSAPLDTACSSSLVALHRALESIHTGSCDMAIVGGVQVMLTPAAFISFGSAGMLSPDGKCKTFDKSANGYVRGEGCGAIFLKSLAAAEADGDHIYAIVKATAENHGGRVTAMTAPNPAAQTDLLIEAYEKGRVDPATVGFIECHGTGTPLGDPIEIQALTKAFSELYKRHGKVPAATPHVGLSSVKTNIGHLETAAGIAGLLKTLLAIKHKQIPANIHLQEVNPYVNLKGTPFYIAEKLTAWPAPVDVDGSPLPRRAGISSFGFGGANAHIVLEEYIAPYREQPGHAAAPQLIVLSAKSGDRLMSYVEALRAFVARSEVELIDLAYTLQVGRDEMPERLALVVSDMDDLKRKLREILEGGTPAGAYRHSASKKLSGASADASVVQALIEGRALAKLAELWTSGGPVEWRLLYEPGVPRRVSAPTYPFARERYWFPLAEKTIEKGSRATAVAPARLHPLIHRNVSTFTEQKFAARFSGEEFFLSDHVIGTQKTLPGVAYVEMARVAGEMSAGRPVRVIRSLTWERPLVVGGEPKEAEVAVAPAGNDVEFTIRTVGSGGAITHCRGRLGYAVDKGAPPERLDIAAIRERCKEQVMTRDELYPFLSGAGLNLGKGFQIVERMFANPSESLAILSLPEHLRAEADEFWLHPALMDGSLHTAIGLLKAKGMDARMGLPYSVGEVQIVHPLRDLHYGYATWTFDSNVDVNGQKVTFHLLDRNGTVLVRLKDFTTKPLHAPLERRDRPRIEPRKADLEQGELQALMPMWNPVAVEARERVVLAPSSRILLLGGSRSQLKWVRTDYPNAELVELAHASGVDVIAESIRGRSFDELLWVAPDVPDESVDLQTGESIIEQQERGVLSVFRTIKALLYAGYGNKTVQWTILTGHTQRVAPREPNRPAHAGILGLVGSLAKEYPHWKVRLLDLDSLESASAAECLTLPFDGDGDALAHRYGEWFRQSLALVSALPEAGPVYRENGVYVVVGGAGGLGEVWSRYMIERHHANMVWIGRREYDASIEAKVKALAELGPAPLYITADASDPAALDRARRTILDLHPTIHGVVHSAMVLRDQSLARMDEPAFRASLSAKIDVSVNMDRVFGNDPLDFMLFFSSIVSVMKTPGQSNYAAGCTFKDSFAHSLQIQRPYPVKIMNWGYWGSVGVVADEAHNRIMRQIGLGSIEPHEGMAALRTLVGSNLHQLALIKTLNDQITAALGVIETVTYHPKSAPRTILPPAPRELAAQALV
jgi:acyl transferase domain-containing protein/tryptophanase/acyl carrier protein